MPEVTRSCGTCTLCCKLPAQLELSKPEGGWCPHCIKTGGTEGGCAIYADRPESCRQFQCLWILGSGTDDLKPDRSHVVLQAIPGENRLTAYCDTGYPDAFRKPDMYGLLTRIAANGVTVVVVTGKHGILLKDGREYKGDLEFVGLTRVAKFNLS